MGSRLNGAPLYVESRDLGLVVHLDVQVVSTSREMEAFRTSGQEAAVQFDVVIAFNGQLYCFWRFQLYLCGEFHHHVVAVHFPKGREEGAAFGAAVLHAVTQPDFVITRVPDPGSLRLGRFDQTSCFTNTFGYLGTIIGKRQGTILIKAKMRGVAPVVGDCHAGGSLVQVNGETGLGIMHIGWLVDAVYAVFSDDGAILRRQGVQAPTAVVVLAVAVHQVAFDDVAFQHRRRAGPSPPQADAAVGEFPEFVVSNGYVVYIAGQDTYAAPKLIGDIRKQVVVYGKVAGDYP